MAGPDHSELQRHWHLATGMVNSQEELKAKYFEQLVNRHASFRRKYHNLNHIYALLEYIQQYENQLTDPNLIRLAVWYHDAIYRPLKKDNEARSASLADKQLSDLGIPADIKEKVNRLILATASHSLSFKDDDFDGRFFMDIDLSILGAHREKYVEYMWQIRKELVLVPRFIYKKGRVKALEQLLGLRHIYKTDIFSPLEARARENIQLEIRYWQYY